MDNFNYTYEVCDFCEELETREDALECAYCGVMLCVECQIHAEDGIICPECGNRFNTEVEVIIEVGNDL